MEEFANSMKVPLEALEAPMTKNITYAIKLDVALEPLKHPTCVSSNIGT